MSSIKCASPVSSEQAFSSPSHAASISGSPEATPAASDATLDDTDASRWDFVIDWENIWHGGKRLLGARRRPRHKRVVGTRIKESWIYRYGANLEHRGVRYWLCKICHIKKSYSTASYASSETAHAARHLLRQHQIAESGERVSGLKTPFSLASGSTLSSFSPASQQTNLGYQIGSHFDEEAWKARFVDWIIVEDVTFRQASGDRLRWLIANGGELASRLLPEHHTTICSWIRLSFESRRHIIAEIVKKPKSSVHISFDLWTASNAFNYLGTVGRFVDQEGKKRDVLLGRPRIIGPHSGENIAHHVKEVIDQYELGSKLGYFMLDNAKSNDACLETLIRWFPMDVNRCRLSCIGHIINLVVRAIVFGSNVSKFEAELRVATDEFKYNIWAKKGAIGRLHNIATYIRRTDQRRQVLRRLQTELAGDDPIFTLEIVVDGKTRWNSIYMMIKRALELRCAIELFQSRWQKPPNDPDHRDLTSDFLNTADWIELERFYELLKPFYILTKTMEGNASKPGAEGGHGAVWETLKTMDYLFMKFKQAAEVTRLEEASHFKSGIDCGYDYFERHWKKAMNKPHWYRDMQLAVGSLFDEYRRQVEVEAQAQAGFLDDDSEKADADNNYSSFGKRSISSLNPANLHPRIDVANPLEWWNRHRLEYPVLYRMALDLFSIPGMSAECERVFNQTKKMITDERNRLSPEIVEADQLQKHWLMRDIWRSGRQTINPTGPPTQTDLDRQTDSHVVRGICDYSDTHKGDEWQGYAALAAATYAKALLKRVPPDDVAAEKRISEILSGISNNVQIVREMFANGQVERRRIRQEEAYNKCLKLLRPTDPRDDKRRIEQTNGGLLIDSYRWILDHPEFVRWREDNESRLLWIKGDPGKGKTIASRKLNVRKRSSSSPISGEQSLRTRS
ncbi:hypothetical protein HIM_09667 [Hirsutella minnesotensis 3608]|uniref:Uncharacterized protein n=1 Tax=Hirsutella minnesotensis 3608 TaxID=1043627 RepID=A0A0F7ZS93_9HYPO|nr:hypothetical protein HIM_09667 [Hirsutella minnesotensis 3608]